MPDLSWSVRSVSREPGQKLRGDRAEPPDLPVGEATVPLSLETWSQAAS